MGVILPYIVQYDPWPDITYIWVIVHMHGITEL